jgi:simple sugar transport system substrate-binding protein/ribose transport system substrate-binding protein
MKLEFNRIARIAFTAAAAAGALGLINQAHAQNKGLDEPSRAEYRAALNGKTVAYLPIALSFDLAQGWLQGLKKELEPLGVNIVVRDPNWDSNAGAQALTTLISQKPAAIVVHNPDLQTYAKLLKRAEDSGIKIIQVNMRSVYPTAVYVGPDWVEVGEKAATALVGACKGRSGKIAIVQGPISSAPSAYTLKGVENVLSKNPQLTVVSSQAADWDAARAKGITQTVLRQHPDLCGIVGFWDGMDIGTAAAIKEAGLTGKVFLATSGGGEQKGACDQVKSGAFDLDLSYDVPTQATTMAASIKWLLQTGDRAKEAKGSIYTTLIPLTKANASVEGTCWKLGKAG